MVKIWLAGRMREGPIGHDSALLLDHCGQARVPWQRRQAGHRYGGVEDQHVAGHPRGAIGLARHRALGHAFAITCEVIGSPVFGRGQVQFHIGFGIRRLQEDLETGVVPESIGAVFAA